MPHTTITIREKAFVVGKLPPIDVCEDLATQAFRLSKHPGVPLLRIYAALVVLMVPEVGFGLGVGGVAEARADLASLGGEALVKLRERKWTNADLADVGGQLFPMIMASAFPAQEDIETAAGKSSAAAG